MSESTTLKPFEPSHLQSLARWLASPSVARWYPDPEDNLHWASQPPEGGAHAVIETAGVEIGYIRWQRVTRETLDSLGLSEIPDESIDIDILIGEESFLGKGIGTTALLRLMDRLRLAGDVSLAGLSPDPKNAMAIRSYEKAGFRFNRDYMNDGRSYNLMTLELGEGQNRSTRN